MPTNPTKLWESGFATRRPPSASRGGATFALLVSAIALSLMAGAFSACSTAIPSSQPQAVVKPKQPPWGYRVTKVGCPDLMVAAFPYLNNKDHGENICLDDAGSCLNRVGPRCWVTGSPKDCVALGPGWSSIFGATCSNGCEPMPGPLLYRQGIYGVIPDPATQCLSLVRYPNIQACKKALPGPVPFISRCIVVGNIPNCKDHCY